MQLTELLQLEQVVAVDKALEAVRGELPVLAALRDGSPASFGHDMMSGEFDEDGAFTAYWRPGDECGARPLKP
jgi:hypothetical protein